MAQLIDGKKISSEIKEELKAKVAELKQKGIEGTLAVIQVGNDPASSVYVKNKKRACEYIGIHSKSFELPEETTQEELLRLISDLNEDGSVNGILTQLPVPAHIDEKEIINAISPKKDVDGFHTQNVGSLAVGQEGFVSCTPAGIIELLKRSDVEIDGKHCGQKQYRRKADGFAYAPRECNGDGGAFPYKEFAGNLPDGRHFDSRSRQKRIDNGRFCERRRGCHRRGHTQR